jgi:lipopolysaccharide export system protein LptA
MLKINKKVKFSIKIKILIIFILNTSSSFAVVRPPLLLPPIQIIDTDKKIVINPESKVSGVSKIPTSWGGGALIQEEKEFQGFPVTAYSLSEGAWILHRKIKLSANLIEIIGSDAVSGTLKGNVRVEDSENKITLTAQKGLYDKLKETIILDGRPTLFYYNSENKLTRLTAPKILRYMSEDKIALEGGVILQDPDYTILCESATYFEKAAELKMDNNPFIFGNNIFLSGNIAVYNNNTKITKLEGNTIIVRRSSDEKTDEDTNQETQKKEELKVSYFAGNKLEVISKLSNREERIELTGDSKVIQEDYQFSGDNLSAFGINYKNLKSNEDFIFFDKKSNIKIFGKLFEHIEEKGYTHITEDPKIEFMNKSGEVSSTLTTVELERFDERKEIVARGDVQILSESGIIRGQFATYYEEEKKILVNGNPSIERDGSKISCGLIIIYPETNRILLSDGLGNIKEK